MLKAFTGGLGLVLCLCIADVSAQVYRWVDEQGQTHFTTTPPPQQRVESVDIRLNYEAGSAPASPERSTAAPSGIASQPATATSRSAGADTSINCDRVMDYHAYDVPNLRDIQQRNLQGGYITQAEYRDNLKKIETAARTVTRQACQSATGAQQTFFACLERGLGLFMCYQW